MKPWLKYSRAFSIGIQNGMVYRSDFLLSLISCVFPIVIQFFMWGNIYGSDANKVLFGYTYSQMISYSVLASLVSRLTRTGFEYEINDDIKNGGLNKYIVRPVHYFPYRLFSFLGQKIAQLGLISVLIIIILAVLSGFTAYSPNAVNVLFFLVSLVPAFALNFMIFFCLSMVAFWLSEIGFFFEAVRIVFIAFSGGIFPLDIFSGTFLSVLNYLPFKYTVNFPVDILNGRLQTDGILIGLLVQMMWILVMAALTGLIWNIGSKKYIAAGG